MEFGIEKCDMQVMKSGKRHMTEGIKQPNKVVIRTPGEKETYKIFGDIGSWHHKQVEMKEKNQKGISEESENYSWQNSFAETLLKE